MDKAIVTDRVNVIFCGTIVYGPLTTFMPGGKEEDSWEISYLGTDKSIEFII